MTTVAFSAIGSTTATATVAGMTSGFDRVEVQLSPASDFSFVVNTIVRIDGKATTKAITGLNQATAYYARARAWTGSVAEPWGMVTGFRTALSAAQATAPATVMIEPAMVIVPEPVLQIYGAALAGFPETNMLRDSPVSYRYNFGATPYVGSIYIDIAGAVVDTLAILASNLPEDCVVNIYATSGYRGARSTTLVSNAAFRASANLPGRRGYHGLWSFAASAYGALEFAWTSTQQFVSIQNLVVGKNRVSRNHAIEKTEEPSPLTSIERHRSGVADRVRGLPMRKVEFEIQAMTELQYETVYGDLIYRENEAVLVVPNAKKGGFFHDRILFGDLGGSRITNVSSPRFTRGFAINSII